MATKSGLRDVTGNKRVTTGNERNVTGNERVITGNTRYSEQPEKEFKGNLFSMASAYRKEHPELSFQEAVECVRVDKAKSKGNGKKG